MTQINPSAHFSPVGFAQFDLQPGETKDIEIEFDPNDVANTWTETLTVTCIPATLNTQITCRGSGRELISSIQFSRTSFSFGNVALGIQSASQTLTVINDGETDWQIDYSQAPAGSSFNWGLAYNGPLAAGQDRDIPITFTPNAEGADSETLVINYNGSQSITMDGFGIMDVSFSETSFVFGSVPLGITETRTLTISNNNGIPIQISYPGTPAGSTFDWGAAFNGPLAAGQSMVIPMTFTPAVEGSDSANFTVTYDGKTQRIDLEAIGFMAVSFSEVLFEFGTIPVGSPASDNLNIQNNNGIPIQVSYPDTPAGSTFSWGAGVANQVIAAGQDLDIPITFDPTSDAEYNEEFDVTYDGRTQRIRFHGYGCVPNTEVVVPNIPMISFGQVQEGLRAIQQISLSNNGDIPALLQCRIEGADSSLFGIQAPNDSIAEPVPIRDYTINPVTSCGSVQTGTGTIDVILVFHAMDTPRLENNADFVILEEPGSIERARIPLEAEIVAASSVDVALVLDRSGSMAESSGVRAKHEAALSSARLFIKLLRSDYDDRLSVVRFNQSGEVIQEIVPLTTVNKDTIQDSITEDVLSPSGSTSIAAGLMNGQDQIGTPRDSVPPGLQKGIIILTDGKDNTPYLNPNDGQWYSLLGGFMTTHWGAPNVDTLPVPTPSDTRLYSVGLGTEDNIDLGRLGHITALTGGYHQTVPEFAGQSYFDLEKFYVQVFMDMVGMSVGFDPTYTINPGEQHTIDFEVDQGDSRFMVVIYNHGGRLPFTLISPTGEYFTLNLIPDGYGSRYEESDTGHLLEIILPMDAPNRYVGTWGLRIIHDGKLESKAMMKRLRKRRALPEMVMKRVGSSYAQQTMPITYSLTIGVKSPLKLLPITPSQIIKAGEVLTLEALVKDLEGERCFVENQLEPSMSKVTSQFYLRRDTPVLASFIRY